MFSRIKDFIRKYYKPRYLFQLDTIQIEKNQSENIYIFKMYGSSAFIKYSFDEIDNNTSLKILIAPDDLIRIYLNEERKKYDYARYKIKESIRGNHYLLSRENEKVKLSGEDFCNDVQQITATNSLDVFKIAYETGFQAGRKTTKLFQIEVENFTHEVNTLKSTNVVKLDVISS